MIKFGTDGWRAIISEQFTFENVRKVARAIALYLLKSEIRNSKSEQRKIIIGYDPRFLADKFAEEIAKVMLEAGLDCFLTERDTPTPIIAWSVKDKKASGAVVLTASHNPPEYCGIKFITEFAGPADATITRELQTNSNKEFKLPKAKNRGKIERFEPRERYLKYLKSFVDASLIKKAKLKVVYDAMHGAGRGYLDRLLQDLGCQVEVINGNRDVLFGGQNPEPAEEGLAELKMRVVETQAQVGLANDGDADRFGVVDEKGQFLHANQVIPLIFEYLVTEKKQTGEVVRSIATSHLLDKLAASHKIKVNETPVGFKYIADLMMKKPIIIGGEESGGLSVKGHIPEKDGLLANLLVVEMLAKYKKPLSQIWQDLVGKYGAVYNQRVNLEMSQAKKDKFMAKLPKAFSKLNGLKVLEIKKLDGIKLIFDDASWLLARPSGTEPLVRVYAEAGSLSKLKAMLKAIGGN